MSSNRQLGRWYQDWLDDLLRFFGRHGQSRADSWDLAQEVYLRLLRTENLPLIDHPRAYVHRIAANVLAEWTVRAPRSRPHSSAALDDLVEQHEPGDVLDEEMRERVLKHAIGRLPELLRATIVLHCQESLSYREIAVRLGASERMVKRYLAKAYARLRMEIGS